MELKDTRVGSAIEALFRGSGKNMAISSDIDLSKTVTATFKDISFEAALKTILKSDNLVYRVDGGVYMISNKPATSSSDIVPVTQVDTTIDNTTVVETQIEKIPLMNISASDVLAILKGETNKNNTNQGYGMQGGMNQGYGSQGYGMQGGMNQGYGSRMNQGYGNQSYGGMSYGAGIR
jgi:hypothetical protein